MLYDSQSRFVLVFAKTNQLQIESRYSQHIRSSGMLLPFPFYFKILQQSGKGEIDSGRILLFGNIMSVIKLGRRVYSDQIVLAHQIVSVRKNQQPLLLRFIDLNSFFIYIL